MGRPGGAVAIGIGPDFPKFEALLEKPFSGGFLRSSSAQAVAVSGSASRWVCCMCRARARC